MNHPDLLNQTISDSYDETPYTSNAFPFTAPGHLHAVAHLYGVTTPLPSEARVLELGCAAGGNLLPFVLAHPKAKAVGVDLSPQQIASGQLLIDQLKIRNLELRAMSITDIDATWGKFDYIICHGVFSWVPPEVREAILRVCRENLKPNGLAYISYNTYPGWKASDIVRDAMLLNSYAARSPQEKLGRAKQMLSLLEHGLWAGNAMNGALTRAAHQVAKQSDDYLAHEYLEAVNSPCYFLEFVAAIQQSGMAYLTDAEPQSTFPSTYGANVVEHLKDLDVETTREMREQYLDFAVGRQFRKSLIMHAEQASMLLDNPEATHFRSMHFAAKIETISDRNPGRPAERAYLLAPGNTLTTESFALIAVLERLKDAWPASVPFAALSAAVALTMPTANSDAHSSATLSSLTLLMNANALQFRLEPAPYTTDEPTLSLIPGALKLLTAIESRDGRIGAHNFWHQAVKLNMESATLFVTKLLDGSRTRQELRTELRNALSSGHVEHPLGVAVKGVRNLDPVAQELLSSILRNLRKVGLLLLSK
ncbi:MAG: class I SAM-dependent methyltransferase [Achromobacter sp.]|uniref:class I SAM-dependent methyltransferase n=1 Tax=Achromobacter sp. TaxID=134375 RepID=UPI0029BB3E72|nr:class I SAM-dependent methyltransferase [Achromobacter sp.]MDX3986653.1 class I SAM-dependent methyltransferase [Achromobacter sp.]